MKTMDRLFASALLAGLCYCIPVSVSGQVWTGLVNQNWFTRSNWIPLGPPASSSTTFILTAPPANISSSGATASILNLGTGGTLNVNSGGGLAVGNAINLGLGGTLNLLGTGTLTSHSIVLALGTMNFNRTSPAAVFDMPIGGVGTVDVLGGTTILGVNNSYLGETNITGGGSLAVGAPFATGFSSVSVLNGTLKTTSLVNTHVPMTINVGGNYTQGSSGTLELGVAGLRLSQYDRVQAVGTARLGGGLEPLWFG
jgi:hypothetical protein